MKAVFTLRAQRDLESIGDWIAQDNPRRAESFVRELREACRDLSESPRAFPLLPRYEAFAIRRKAHRGYLILYRIIDDTVEISHVLHGARDYYALLSEEFE